MTPHRIQYTWPDAVAIFTFFAFSIPWTAREAWSTGDGTFAAMAVMLVALAARIIWLYVHRSR